MHTGVQRENVSKADGRPARRAGGKLPCWIFWQHTLEGGGKVNGKSHKETSGCDSCGNYVYDGEYGYYVCEANLDEDEMARFLLDKRFDCPYYHLGDEYQVVRRQM